MQTWLPLLRTLWSLTIESSILIYDALREHLGKFFHCNSLNRLFIILKYFIKMLYTPYCDLYLILLLDKATGCFDWSFDTSKYHWHSEHLKKNIYGFRASQVQCFGCFCLENILVYSYLFLSADVKFMWRYFDFWHVPLFFLLFFFPSFFHKLCKWELRNLSVGK